MGKVAVSLATLTGVMVWLAGCGGGPAGPKVDRADAVSGKVTLDGKPVQNGTVMFTPDKAAGNKGPRAAAKITDGKYSTPSGKGPVVGKNIVAIYAVEKTGKELAGGMQEEKNLLADKFNTKSTKSVEIKAGSQTLDFKLPDDWQ